MKVGYLKVPKILHSACLVNKFTSADKRPENSRIKRSVCALMMAMMVLRHGRLEVQRIASSGRVDDFSAKKVVSANLINSYFFCSETTTSLQAWSADRG
jgi:hypothetical protein